MAERESMDYDVVIVGAGPAGLSAAIRLKQLDADLSVVVIEKGSEVGAHVLSGAVLDPVGLDALIPDWRDRAGQEGGAPVTVPVTSDTFYVLGEGGAARVPNRVMPPLMSNHRNYVVSMGNVCRWLATQAEALGVDIFPATAASALLMDGERVAGVVAGEMGRVPDGSFEGAEGPSYEPGMELRGKYVLLGEGVRGSLSQQVIERYGLERGHEPQKYGLGMKELWQVDPARHRPGTVMHTMGWPLGGNAGGGSFIYHLDDNQVYVGFVVHLNYRNPHLDPYREFQRFKHHPLIADLLQGGTRISYGARAITEGGWQSLPDLAFPGGALMGCAAGMVNVPRIKGNHNAMLSGIHAAEAAHAAIAAGREGDALAEYDRAVREGPVGRDLRAVRNVKPAWSRRGHGACHRPIAYPRPDGVLSFDRATNIAFSGTNHDASQPAHLKLRDPSVPIRVNLPLYDEPSQRYCPAGVYEVVQEEAGPRFQINFQNCVHCKTCDIKDPSRNIVWTVPQGGDGPNYPNM